MPRAPSGSRAREAQVEVVCVVGDADLCREAGRCSELRIDLAERARCLSLMPDRLGELAVEQQGLHDRVRLKYRTIGYRQPAASLCRGRRCAHEAHKNKRQAAHE
jgi:hypothetical protein